MSVKEYGGLLQGGGRANEKTRSRLRGFGCTISPQPARDDDAYVTTAELDQKHRPAEADPMLSAPIVAALDEKIQFWGRLGPVKETMLAPP